MRKVFVLFACCAVLLSRQTTTPASDNYPLQADSLPKPGVTPGVTFEFSIADSKIFPGTTRVISVYVPAEYKGDKPACVYVGFDGLAFRANTVFDNLIAKHAMPITIGVGIKPGAVPSASAPDDPRFDRSFEFDSMTDRLARFVLEEVLPAVEKHTAPDGRKILLSKNPDDRATGGSSTGAIAAFNLAWQRPDEFRRVFSSIGTYVGMRGGEGFYVLVRKTEPKPLRVFMQDGANDEWGGGPEIGDWWMSNQTMERALSFAGYDVRHVWGTGTHSGSHAESLFPEAMTWLWRDWPQRIRAGQPGNPVLKAILQDGEDWQPTGKTCSDGPLIVDIKGELQSCGNTATTKVLEQGRHVLSSVRRESGDVYFTAENSSGDGEIWLVRSNGERVLLDRGLRRPAGIAFSPDGLWLMVSQSKSRWAMNYKVRTDGTLEAGEPLFEFAMPPGSDYSGAGQIWMDRDGRSYVASNLGVQVFDRNGRVTAILPLPTHSPVTGLAFGGEDFKTLYVVSNGKILRRRLRVAGAPPWITPMKLPVWGAG